MWEDPIVAEVHRTREKLAAECNYDITTFFADVRKRQAALGGRLVHQKQRAATHRAPAAEVDRARDIGPPGSTPSETAPAT
jgi:hypothetical protein